MDAVHIWPSVRAAGLPMLVSLHGHDINTDRSWWESGQAGLRARVYPRRLIAMSRHPRVAFVAVSNAVRRRAIEYGLPAEKITVRYIGVDTEQFTLCAPPLNARRRQILFVGRMVEKKAPLLMVRAYALVRKRLSDVSLTMIGDGPLRQATEELASNLGVPVNFTGALSSEHVRRWMQKARVFCLPSVTAANGDAEGLPISLLEAQSSGVPVVTTRHSGNPEALLEGSTGLLVNEQDCNALSEALCFALTNEAFLESASALSASFIQQRFCIRNTTRALEEIYDHLCQDAAKQ
jgi:glycosyltransferase involved in cell wall biosynthesis